MDRSIELQAGAVVEGDAEEVIELRQDEIAKMALEIVLLSHGLSDSLTVWTRSGHKLVLRLNDEDPARVRVTRGAQQLRYGIPGPLLGYLESTLLRAYRDGVADVNHIHLEGEIDDRSFDLTFLFALSRAPMSPEEVARQTR